MNLTQRWLATFPQRPTYTLFDRFAWLLCGWVVVYVCLLHVFDPRIPVFDASIYYAPMVLLLGNSVLLIATRQQAQRHQDRHYGWACTALLVVQILNILTILFTLQPYQFGETLSVGLGFGSYVLVYLALICSIGFFVPFWRFPPILVLRITLDTAILMAMLDVGLRFLLPTLIPTWQWTPPLLACVFRLESTIGLVFWYSRLFARFGNPRAVPLRLWMLGFGCLVVNDVLVVWATFQATHYLELVRTAIPFWMLNQTLWTLALYRTRQTPLHWQDTAASPPSRSTLPLWQQIMRHIVAWTTLAIVIATGPALTSVLWFFCALVSRELLTLCERERVITAERQARETLAARHQEVLQINAALRRAEQAVFAANAQLQHLSALQAEQLEQRQIRAAEVAHDMGNLLQPARVTLALIEELMDTLNPADAALLRPYLATMEENVLMSENLLKTIVAAARLDAGGLTLNLSCIALDTLLMRVVQYQQARDLRPPVQIHVDLPRALPPVVGDADLLMRALLNVVGNAVKYTAGAHPDGTGLVTITARATDQHVELQVRDNGTGIDPAVQARLGQSFMRGVDDARAPAGFGLGLAFSRGVIEHHPGGALTLQSGVGAGTTVTIILARHPEPAVAAP